LSFSLENKYFLFIIQKKKKKLLLLENLEKKEGFYLEFIQEIYFVIFTESKKEFLKKEKKIYL
jgi:hypothetical protein